MHKPGTQAKWVSEEGLSGKSSLLLLKKDSHTQQPRNLIDSTGDSQQQTASQWLGNNNNSNNKNINAKQGHLGIPWAIFPMKQGAA